MASEEELGLGRDGRCQEPQTVAAYLEPRFLVHEREVSLAQLGVLDGPDHDGRLQGWPGLGVGEARDGGAVECVGSVRPAHERLVLPPDADDDAARWARVVDERRLAGPDEATRQQGVASWVEVQRLDGLFHGTEGAEVLLDSGVLHPRQGVGEVAHSQVADGDLLVCEHRIPVFGEGIVGGAETPGAHEVLATPERVHVADGAEHHEGHRAHQDQHDQPDPHA